jgi:hypothetical protein
MRDKVGIDFEGNPEAIKHCKELAQHFRDVSKPDQFNGILLVRSVSRPRS